MASIEVTRDDTLLGAAGKENKPYRLRSYQAEMVEESLTENIIVAMDTGSGKTHMYASFLQTVL